MKEPMNIITSCDSNGLYLQKLSLLNLMKSNADEDIHIYFLSMSLTDEEKLGLSELVAAHSNFGFDLVDVPQEYSDFVQRQIALWNRSFYVNNAPERFIRLCIPFLFPDMKKCMWLDNDVFVMKPLGLIYDTELKDTEYLGAYHDPLLDPVMVQPMNKALFISCGVSRSSYFNNGVLLFNMDAYRKGLSMALFEKINKKAGKYFDLQEQDLLNLLSVGHTKLLDENRLILCYQDIQRIKAEETVNERLEHFDDVVFIHTCGLIKPCHDIYHFRRIADEVYTPFISLVGDAPDWRVE